MELRTRQHTNEKAVVGCVSAGPAQTSTGIQRDVPHGRHPRNIPQRNIVAAPGPVHDFINRVIEAVPARERLRGRARAQQSPEEEEEDPPPYAERACGGTALVGRGWLYGLP